MAVIYGTEGADKKTGTNGNDLIHGWATGAFYTSPSGNDTLDGAAGNDSLYGGTGKDSLIGGTANDLLDGNAGSDTLNGGTGNDTYIVDSIIDKITEAASSGTDTVESFLSYTLAANLENLTQTGNGAINGTGNSLNNTITGNAANNTLNGGTGNDTLVGGVNDNTGNDTLYGGDGNDQLYSKNVTVSSPFTGADVLYGGNGNDSLNGGYGANNTLNGGSGNDTYTVFTTAADTIVEAEEGGTDTVQSRATYTLGNNLENLTLTGTGAINATGNSLNNIIIGTSADNVLYGLAANDKVYGGAGNDTLGDNDFFTDNDAGNDSLYSGAGDDKLGDDEGINNLYGDAGNDTLFSDSYEGYLNGGDGNDTLRINNYFADGYSLDGGTGDDFLYGTGGVDTLDGGDGNDLLSGDGDTGSISVYGGDYLNGGNGNDTLYGDGENDTIIGGTGNDFLTGGFGGIASLGFYDFGNDTLTGAIGADNFAFYSPSEGFDTITDFSVTNDTISVSASGFGGGLTTGAAITTNQFVLGSAAVDKSDHFIYNQNTGSLFFDSDGTGATEQVQFASLTNKPLLTNGDIVVV